MQVDINCAALPCIDAGELFFVTSELEHANGSQGFASDPFNVETANLLITNAENLYWQGTLNSVKYRTLTIRNTRPGRVAAFEFLDAHASSIAVSSNDGETIVENADTLLLRFGPQDFAQIGNGDGWFDFNEELTIRERVQVVDCAAETRDALSELWVRWGCGGSFCQSRRANGKVEIVTSGSTGDVLSFFSKKARNPDCYDGGVAAQSFRMSRSGQSHDLINFQMTLHQPGNGRGIRLGSVTTSLGISIIDSVFITIRYSVPVGIVLLQARPSTSLIRYRLLEISPRSIGKPDSVNREIAIKSGATGATPTATAKNAPLPTISSFRERVSVVVRALW